MPSSWQQWNMCKDLFGYMCLTYIIDLSPVKIFVSYYRILSLSCSKKKEKKEEKNKSISQPLWALLAVWFILQFIHWLNVKTKDTYFYYIQQYDTAVSTNSVGMKRWKVVITTWNVT